MSQRKDKEKIIFFTESGFKVARLIFNYPNKTFHIRLLERETGLSTTAVIDAVERLSAFKIVKIVKTELVKNISADLESDAYRFYKLVFNLYRLKRYLLIEKLVYFYSNPESITLFGSFSKGEDVEESDIDILIITSHKPDKRISKFIEIVEKEMNRRVNIHALSSLDRSAPEFKNAAANGITLHGYLKVV